MPANHNPIRVRFAPSPTGHLHVGGARTAIFNWLFARHHGGSFILRVEDTDQERSTRESEGMVLSDLRWLGLDWDEGPDIGGPWAPYRQSERRETYGGIAKALVSSGNAYPCFCTEEELDERRSATEHEGVAPHYDLRCYRLAADDVAARIESGDAHAIRFHVPKESGESLDGDVTIDDLIRGKVTWKKETLGDFILVRSDGMPTYNFSVVVDDHLMAISHVIRAEEHLTNTHRQVLIYRAMGWETPHFAHVSLILGEDRSKLSKRHGATSVAAYAESGFLPGAMFNYLSRLGWTSAEEREFFPIDYAVKHFSLDRVNAAPAVFDQNKLTWLNGQHIHQTAASALYEGLEARFRNAGWITSPVVSADARRWFEEAIEAVKKKVQRLDEFVDAMRFLFEFDPAQVLEANRTLLANRDTTSLLKDLVSELCETGAPSSVAEYKALTEQLKSASGLKAKELFMPIRIALTGADHGPDLQRIFALLEKGSSIEGLALPVEPALRRIEGVLNELRR
ncbi:MAG TPA: glutamate--tRNA ligase [Thermoanaerobaculia bacterium]|nr:glutamate--tRNA ligase [Thermoanaerobaculia bacterium]